MTIICDDSFPFEAIYKTGAHTNIAHRKNSEKHVYSDERIVPQPKETRLSHFTCGINFYDYSCHESAWVN